MDAKRTILLDSGRAVRVHPDEELAAGLGPGSRVTVRQLEVDGTQTWARGIGRTDVPYPQRDLEGLVPPKTPPPPAPEVVAQRQKEYDEQRARLREQASEQRR